MERFLGVEIEERRSADLREVLVDSINMQHRLYAIFGSLRRMKLAGAGEYTQLSATDVLAGTFSLRVIDNATGKSHVEQVCLREMLQDLISKYEGRGYSTIREIIEKMLVGFERHFDDLVGSQIYTIEELEQFNRNMLGPIAAALAGLMVEVGGMDLPPTSFLGLLTVLQLMQSFDDQNDAAEDRLRDDANVPNAWLLLLRNDPTELQRFEQAVGQSAHANHDWRAMPMDQIERRYPATWAAMEKYRRDFRNSLTHYYGTEGEQALYRLLRTVRLGTLLQDWRGEVIGYEPAGEIEVKASRDDDVDGYDLRDLVGDIAWIFVGSWREYFQRLLYGHASDSPNPLVMPPRERDVQEASVVAVLRRYLGAGFEFAFAGRRSILTIYLTRMCDHSCVSCKMTRPRKGEQELNRGEWFVLFEHLVQLGVKFVSLVGGEPTTLPWLEELVEHAKRLGIFVSVTTNGHHLLNTYREHQDTKKLVGIIGKPNSLVVSAHGFESTKEARPYDLLEDLNQEMGLEMMGMLAAKEKIPVVVAILYDFRRDDWQQQADQIMQRTIELSRRGLFLKVGLAEAVTCC
jgi:hypothetical protein